MEPVNDYLVDLKVHLSGAIEFKLNANPVPFHMVDNLLRDVNLNGVRRQWGPFNFSWYPTNRVESVVVVPVGPLPSLEEKEDEGVS